MGRGKRQEPRLFPFPFPSSPGGFPFRSLQPSLRYKEASAEERGDQVSTRKTGGRGIYKPRGILNFVSFKYQTFPREQSWTSSGNWKCNKISKQDDKRRFSYPFVMTWCLTTTKNTFEIYVTSTSDIVLSGSLISNSVAVNKQIRIIISFRYNRQVPLLKFLKLLI